MDKKVLEILVCPKCNSRLKYDKKANELICEKDALAFPVRDGIPVMLEAEARELSSEQPAEQ